MAIFCSTNRIDMVENTRWYSEEVPPPADSISDMQKSYKS